MVPPWIKANTSNPTPEQLAAMIQQYTPQNIKDQYPQVVAFATPLIINAVESAIAHYGTDNATVIKVVNDVATANYEHALLTDGRKLGTQLEVVLEWFVCVYR